MFEAKGRLGAPAWSWPQGCMCCAEVATEYTELAVELTGRRREIVENGYSYGEQERSVIYQQENFTYEVLSILRSDKL